MKSVIILPAAARALRRHRADAGRLLEKIETYADSPKALANNIKALSGSRAFRLRVGDYRIIFEETDTEIIVTNIGPRGSIYE
jgi:mRNA interferase RelE/StbE